MPTSKGFVWTGSSSGCLLPFLIVFNLFFGKLIFSSTRLWLTIEAVLVLVFILKVNIFLRKLTQPSNKSRGNVIDISGQVVDEKSQIE